MMEKKTNLKKLDPAQLSLLCAQWAMILKTGILLYDGADILVSTYENTSEQALFERIAGALEEGQPFYEALESTGRFPKYMIEMVRIAERTGNLDVVLDSLSKYYKKEALRNENIQNAIFYPVTLVVMMSVVIAILVVKVIPVFMQVFRNMGVSLDGSTQTILSAGIFVGYAVMVFAILLSVFAIVVIAMWKKGKPKRCSKARPKSFRFRKSTKGRRPPATRTSSRWRCAAVSRWMKRWKWRPISCPMPSPGRWRKSVWIRCARQTSSPKP